MKKKTLMSMVKTKMSKRQEKAIKRIDAEDCDMIIYLTHKDISRFGKYDNEYFEAGCLALKQYYATTIFDPRNMHALSDALDPFWHAHLLDTVQYELLGKDIKGFMHHDPLNRTDIVKVGAVKKVYDYTVQTLGRIFGEENLDERFYPRRPAMSAMVCLHDIERGIIALKDVFPVNAEIEKLRQNYGHEVRRKTLKRELKRAFA